MSVIVYNDSGIIVIIIVITIPNVPPSLVVRFVRIV